MYRGKYHLPVIPKVYKTKLDNIQQHLYDPHIYPEFDTYSIKKAYKCDKLVGKAVKSQKRGTTDI